MKHSIFFIVLLLLFSACTKVIDINLNASDPQIVVEGEVTNNAGPYFVSISKSINFSDANNYPKIQNAIVKITDGTITDTLVETSAGIYKTTTLQGVSGRTYTLTIVTNGKTITAQSTMPTAVVLDSITFLESTFGAGPGGKNSFAAIPNFKDPSTFGNNYRFIQTINDTLDKSFYVDNDNVINGLKYQRPLFSTDKQMYKGDSLLFEMQCIDKITFEYFNSLIQTIGNGPGGGATPANPVTNVQGGLGYFSAHSSQTKKVVVQ